MKHISRALPRAVWCTVWAAVLVLGASTGAVAQYGDFKTSPNLTAGDIEILRKVVREDLRGKPTGTTLPWRNLTTQNSGTVTLLDRFPSRGRDCLRVRYLIKPNPGQPATLNSAYVLTSCRIADGSWKQDNQAKRDKLG